ncbi:MAG: aminodeoxychorismate lyase [Pseudomonadota bacterium]
MYLINGQFDVQLPIRDRGLAYGDGLFETIAVIGKQAHNWRLHFNRLTDGAKHLKIKMPLEVDFINGIRLFSQQINSDKFILKIILTRGEGGRGYQCPEKQSSNWIMMSNSWPDYPDKYYLNGIDIQQLDFQLSVQPALAGIKHLNRLEQVLARQQLPPDCQEALLSNTDGYIIEGISSNVFFVSQGILFIPLLECSGIEGTMRLQVIRLCQLHNIEYRIANFNLQSILLCEEIFYSNSIIGLWPVKKLSLLESDDKRFKLGSIYRRLSEIINKQLGHPTFGTIV